jgi:hypothetical protein
MAKEIHHLGLYTWTDASGNQRPIRGSAQAERNEAADLKRRAEALNTPEGEAWLEQRGFTKTDHENLEWLTANGKI